MKKTSKVKLHNFLIFWLPPVIWASIIFLFSSIPTVTTSTFYLWDFIIKKSAHFIEYGVLVTLLYRAFINSNMAKNKAQLYSLIISIIYAMTDEFHQSFTPGRGPSIRDVLIDSLGAYFFVYVLINNLKSMPNSIITFAKRIKVI